MLRVLLEVPHRLCFARSRLADFCGGSAWARDFAGVDRQAWTRLRAGLDQRRYSRRLCARFRRNPEAFVR
jgi:hypothetical protein